MSVLALATRGARGISRVVSRISTSHYGTMAIMLALICIASSARAEDRVVFKDSVKPLQGVAARGAVTADETATPIDFMLSLKMRNYDELQARVIKGEIISAAELAKKYYPLASDYKVVSDWLTNEGFEITKADDSHIGVFVKGSVAQIQKSFQVSFAKVTGSDNKTYISAASAPSIPVQVAVNLLGVNGLQPHIRAHVHSRIRPAGEKKPLISNGVPYYPSEILKAYNADGLPYTGLHEQIAIVIDGPPDNNDLTSFWSTTGVTQQAANISVIQVIQGTNPAPSGEETLDVEWASAMAPNAKIRVYATTALTTANLSRAYQQINADIPVTPGLHQVSLSYGINESDNTGSQMNTDAQYFLSMTAQGVTVFSSSGDDGSNPPTQNIAQISNPANDPSVTAVGGTSLTLDKTSGAETTETAWTGSGGGTSSFFNRPTWQVGTGIASGAFRLNPDVSSAADPNTGCLITLNGAQLITGGTSWSSPTWAGFAALINEARASTGLPPLGLLSPKVYPLIGTSNFRDITSGSNGIYTAAAGFDEATGVGVPNIKNLITTLTPRSTIPTINPQSLSNVNVDPSAITHYSSAVAINPSNPTNAVSVSALDLPGGGLAIGVSGNRGSSWVSRHIATGADFPAAGDSPACVFDNFGNLYLTYREITGSQIVVLISSDNGKTFDIANTFTGNNLTQPKITTGPDFTSTTGGGSVWVAYYDTANGNIFVAGAPVISLAPQLPLTFSPPVGLTGGASTAVIGDIAVDSLGEVVVSYQLGNQILTEVDTDGLGPLSFTSPNPVATVHVPDGTLIPAQAAVGISSTPSIAFDRSGGAFNGRLYIVYTTPAVAGSNDTNIFVSYSDDQGQSPWSTPVTVNDGSLGTSVSATSSQFLPRIAVDQVNGYVAVSYYDARNDLGTFGSGDTDGIVNTDTNFYANISPDGGLTFNPSIAATPNGATEAGSTVTITTVKPHGFAVGNVVTISGVAVDGYNGTYRITAVPTLNSFSYTSTATTLAASGSPAKGASAIAALPIKLSVGTSNAAASNALSTKPIDYGSYSGLAYFNGAFISSWSDNSNSTHDNPSGNLGNLQLYTATTLVQPSPALVGGTLNKADLIVSKITVLNPPIAGHAFTVRATITNQGIGDALQFTVSAFSSPSFVGYNDGIQTDFNAIDPSFQKVDNQVVLGLAAGASQDVILTMEYDVNGDQTIAVLVDSQRNVDESNEANNLTTLRLLVGSLGQDIAVRTWQDTVTGLTHPAFVSSVPVGGTAGINAHFDFTLVNLGTRATGTFLVGVYYNRQTAPSASDTPDTTISIASIAPGNFTTGAFDLPTQTVPRGGRAWIFANYFNIAAEIDQTNNIASAVWGVANGAPVVTSPVTLTPTTADVGDTVTFTVGATDPDGDPLIYVWNFGDGSPLVAGGSTITHVYAAPGMYNVTVSVSDGPFTNVTSGGTVDILDATHVDLGFVIAKSGYIKLRVPLPWSTTRSTIITATEANNIVTVTTQLPHGYIVGQPLTISRSLVKGYNGKFTVLSVPSTNTFTYATKPGLADSTGGVVVPVKFKATATIIQTSPVGQNITLKNQILSGKPGNPNVYTFTVEYLVPKTGLLQRVRYSYTVE